MDRAIRRVRSGGLGRVLPLAILAIITTSCTCFGSRIRDPEPLRQKLEEIRVKHRLPAVSVSVVMDHRVVAASAVGVRKWDEKVPATRQDAFWLGSITKPMNGMLVGVLKEQGSLTWQTTIGDALPDLSRQLDFEQVYRDITVRQLLSHTSGLPYQPEPKGNGGASENYIDGEFCQELFVPDNEERDCTVVEKRRAYVAAAELDHPSVTPGSEPIYGGGGVIVASMLEQRQDETWEQLLREHLLRPLRMHTCDFGPMATPPDSVDAPWHHKAVRDRDPQPVAPDPKDYRQPRAPVGRNVHCSASDFGRLAALALRGARGRPSLRPFVSSSTFGEIFKVPSTQPVGTDCEGAKATWTTAGWKTQLTCDEGWVHFHSGSASERGRATVRIVPDKSYATVVMINVPGDGANDAIKKINNLLKEAVAEANGKPWRLFPKR